MLSVIVCTRNRIDRLRRCLGALDDVKTNHKWELVVVDNGSTDGTRDYLATTTAIYVSELRVGLSRARNAGVRAARFDLIAFP